MLIYEKCCELYGIGDHDSVEHEDRIAEMESDETGEMWTDQLITDEETAHGEALHEAVYRDWPDQGEGGAS